MKRSYSEQMQNIVEVYVSAGEPWPASAKQVAAWAIRQNLWQPQPSSLITQCADHLARAMREEYFRDPQGRSVRAKHAARVLQGEQQTTLWADIRTAPRKHMAIALQQRRQQILGDCRQLKADADSYNENRSPTEPIQMVFDFTLDLEEGDLAHVSLPACLSWVHGDGKVKQFSMDFEGRDELRIPLIVTSKIEGSSISRCASGTCSRKSA